MENNKDINSVNIHNTIDNEIVEESKKNNRNFTFDLLYVLAIIMVIDDHTNCQIGILTKIFPYDSFFMPLFVFASGYFFKKQGILRNIKHKIKKLLIPIVVWNIVMLVISFLFDKVFGTRWFYMPTIKGFIISLFNNTMTTLNGPAWFVIMLFWVSIVYNILRNVIKPNKISDSIITGIFTLLGFFTIYICSKGFYSKGWKYVFLFKIAFYIQFYHLGYIFKTYIEKNFQKLNKYFVCGSCICINIILILIFGEKINFYATSEMNGFSYWYLPLITSITGIAFWYTIMNYLSNKIVSNKNVTLIAKNTFTIMETHLLFANLINLICYILKYNGVLYFLNFNSEAFCNSAWNGAAWSLNPFFGIIGFLLGLILSILTAILINRVKNINISKKYKKLEEKNYV